MPKLKINDVSRYVKLHIADFHHQRLVRLDALQLNTVLRKKNPYLFKAKNLLTAEQIVRALSDAFLSSNEETIFGDWLEGLAIYVNKKVYGGDKSTTSGIDLEFDVNGVRYAVAIKSGPNWGNSSQIRKMMQDFERARRTLRTSNSRINMVAVNGCCYGKDFHPDKGSYYKYCGQRFWEFISGDKDLYLKIVEPLGHQAKERNEDFQKLYAQKINLFTAEFIKNYCLLDGSVDWLKLVRFNSGNFVR
ncbi:MAG: hypothetical protein LBK60_02715 [Verrucomicrobiales bacterium]|jgi:hypothetical protein|nr:hypothetical protein [Verrucomicrobiales bacterium]